MPLPPPEMNVSNSRRRSFAQEVPAFQPESLSSGAVSTPASRDADLIDYILRRLRFRAPAEPVVDDATGGNLVSGPRKGPRTLD